MTKKLNLFRLAENEVSLSLRERQLDAFVGDVKNLSSQGKIKIFENLHLPL